MVRRRRFRNRAPQPFGRGTVWLLALILSVIVMLQSFIFIEKNLKEPLLEVAQIRVKQVATDAINEAIASQVANSGEVERLIDWRTDYNGNVTGFMLNYAEHMRITQQVVSIVRETLERKKHLREYIPIGQAVDSAILSTFGPSIPIRFEAAGAPQVDLGTKREDAGINMLLVTVFVRITAEVKIYIPFATDTEFVTTEIPISYILVKGDVPLYYFNAAGGRSDGTGIGRLIPPPVLPAEPAGSGAPGAE